MLRQHLQRVTLAAIACLLPLVAVAGSAVLSWERPLVNTDGSALTNLDGYRIHYGRTAGELVSTIQLNDENALGYVVTDLADGQWFFAVSAFNTQGAESALSNVASTTVSPTPAPVPGAPRNFTVTWVESAPEPVALAPPEITQTAASASISRPGKYDVVVRLNDSPGAEEYVVWRCQAASGASSCSNLTILKTVPAPEDAVWNTSLPAGTTFCYRLVARAGEESSPFSNLACQETGP